MGRFCGRHYARSTTGREAAITRRLVEVGFDHAFDSSHTLAEMVEPLHEITDSLAKIPQILPKFIDAGVHRALAVNDQPSQCDCDAYQRQEFRAQTCCHNILPRSETAKKDSSGHGTLAQD